MSIGEKFFKIITEIADFLSTQVFYIQLFSGKEKRDNEEINKEVS